jgi:hypothetical protein
MTKDRPVPPSSLVILHSSFLGHWWGIGGAFDIPPGMVIVKQAPPSDRFAAVRVPP